MVKHLFIWKDIIPQKHWEQLTETGFHGSRIFKCFLYALILQHTWKLQSIFALFYPGSWTLNCGNFLSHKQLLRKEGQGHTIEELKKSTSKIAWW